MNIKTYLITLLVLCFLSCKAQKNRLIYESNTLKVEKLTKHTFRHISYLSTVDFGKVSCNGMIVMADNEAIIIDTPTSNQESYELIDIVENTLNCKVVGVVVSHFHKDCLGGLKAFHDSQIPSYASFKTIELAKPDSVVVPLIGFKDFMALQVGEKEVHNEFLGAGHSNDNIVAYFPAGKVLFGGCLIKRLGASKGYLGDANIPEWSKTVQAVKAKYHKAKVVVPGHGMPGKMDLLDYTIALFKLE